MALDRTVSVKLKAEIAGYVASLKTAGAQTASFAKGIEQGAIRNRAHLDKLSTGLLAVGAIAGLGVAAAVKSFADFDQAMSGVEAATHESAAGMDLLREAALDAGARTAFSATEAAGAVEALAKAGVTTTDILHGGLSGALDLAAAGSLEVGDAAEIAATAMTQFKLEGKDVPHIADLLAAGAGKAQGEVSDMAMALKQSGLVAAQFGFSIEETTGVLAQFASAGLLGSDAGTSLRTMLLRLANPSGEAAAKMKELGISAYDAAGNMVAPTELAGQLEERMKDLDPATRNAALAIMFGSDAIRGASVLFKDGADDTAGWVDKVNDAGYAAETAAIKMDNLKGDIEKLKGSFSTLLTETGEASDGFLRGATQQLDAFIGLLGDAPGPLKNAALAIGVAATAIGLLGGGAIKAIQGVAGLRTAMAALTLTARTAAITVGTVGAILTVGIGAVALWANEHAKAKQRVDDLTASIVADGNAIGDQTRALVVNRLEQDGVLKAAQSLGISMATVTDAFLGSTSAIAELRTHTTDSVASFSGMTQEVARFNPLLSETEKNATLLVGALGDQTGALADARTAADRQKQALEGSAGATDKAGAAASGAVGPTGELASVQESAADAADAEAAAMDDLADSLQRLEGFTLDTADAWTEFADDLDKLSETVGENGRTLAAHTVEGRANGTALRDLIREADNYAQAVVRQTGSVDKGNQSFDRSVAALRRTAIQTGLSKSQVDRLIDSYTRMPAQKQTLIKTPGLIDAQGQVKNYQDYLRALPKDKLTKITAGGVAGAKASIAEYKRYLDNLPREVQTTIRTIRVEERNTRYKTTGQAPGKWASGGYISGPGGPRTDSIPSWLSNGEYVINAAATAANRSLLEAINGSSLARGATTMRAPSSYAAGGQVTPTPAGPSITYGNVTVANIDELMSKQETKLRDITTMAGLRVGV